MKYLNPLIKLSLGGVVLLMSSPAMAVITGSAHDLALQGWAGDEICAVCHTPHNAAEALSGPLWDHELTATVSFGVYTGTGTLDAVVGQPTGVSLLCLSCHDGTVGVDSFGGSTGPGNTLIGSINANADFGIDLSDDHPIAFDYDLAQGLDAGIKISSTAAGILSNPTGTIDEEMLFGGQMECASCHDVHNSEDVAFLLRKDNGSSLLCLTCHDK